MGRQEIYRSIEFYRSIKINIRKRGFEFGWWIKMAQDLPSGGL
jgi:hypothetical protein